MIRFLERLSDAALAMVVPKTEAAAAPMGVGCPVCNFGCVRRCCLLGGTNLWDVESCPGPVGGTCVDRVYGKC